MAKKTNADLLAATSLSNQAAAGAGSSEAGSDTNTGDAGTEGTDEGTTDERPENLIYVNVAFPYKDTNRYYTLRFGIPLERIGESDPAQDQYAAERNWIREELIKHATDKMNPGESRPMDVAKVTLVRKNDTGAPVAKNNPTIASMFG